MKIVYISNAYGHISGPLCDKLYEVYKDNFAYIATDELDSDRKAVGSGRSREYLIDGKADFDNAKSLCDRADIVIFGSAPVDYIEDRIKNNQTTIYYSERLFKNGYWRYFNPKTMWSVRKRFIVPSRNSHFFAICASSFAALDFHRIGAFRNKLYKWGYQPSVYQKDIDSLINSKPKEGLEFIWVGRLVKLKHCDDAIRVIKRLHDNMIPARMKIIGTGEEEANLKKLTKTLNLQDYVQFMGRCKIDETREMMDKANIFLFTSDEREGWGVTLNECMNSGVACVANHMAGATYFMAKHGENCFVYENGNTDQLFYYADMLVKDAGLREKIGKNAYIDVMHTWNTDVTYKRFITMMENLHEKGTCDEYADGPCSRAEVVTSKWIGELK